MGYSFPNALCRSTLGDLDKLSIDIGHLQYKRDWLVRELSAMGYQVHSPEGTFYLLPRSPIADDWAFANTLVKHNVLVLPAEIVEMPGYFRISLTANDAMIERALRRVCRRAGQVPSSRARPRGHRKRIKRARRYATHPDLNSARCILKVPLEENDDFIHTQPGHSGARRADSRSPGRE